MNNGPDENKFEASAAFAGADGQDPELEAALRQVLRPEAAPAGFADRLMARALAEAGPARPAAVQPGKGKLLHWPQSRWWITAAVAAGLIAGVFEGGLAYRHVREQQRRIVQATQQFQTTERITVHALAQARQQLQRAGVPLNLD